MVSARDMRDAAVGALLGAFVGDALGMPYEGRPGYELPERLEMRDGRAAAGSYTDDTQMMIALAESLLRCDGIDQGDLAAAFRAHYEPERGYGSGTRTVMSSWDDGVPVAEAARRLFGGEGSPRNGAAMRVAPVAVRFFADEAKVISQARRSALVTHAHREAADGAAVQATAVAAALAGREPLAAAIASASTPAMRGRLEKLARWTSSGELDPRELGGLDWEVAYSAVASVPVAVVVGSRAPSFEAGATVAVRCGGDTDTVGAMAGAIAGARFGASNIPARWYAVLEDNDNGRSHVERLAVGLLEAGWSQAGSSCRSSI
jgi:poly(ADP-ribose) glycohydrolase ARH3